VTVHLIPETERLLDANERGVPWRRWGPYLSERQWGTVREDYSDDGEAWSYLTHDEARSRAYRWGEDGLGGICDDEQRLCFALALWNGADPILKERPFGLTNAEGNHGEDVKDYYFYLDATPTSSYLRYLYKYPQRAFPYQQLIRENGMRDRHAMEYELVDTGVFDDDQYFDVFVDYAKATPEDLLVEITVHNRGTEAATLHLLPTLWFRNTWSWSDVAVHPQLARTEVGGRPVIAAEHPELGRRFLELDRAADVLVTENETNTERLWGAANATPYVKDAFHRYVVEGDHDAVNPAGTGTKAAFHLLLEIEGGGSSTVRLRLSDLPSDERADEAFGAGFRRRLLAALDEDKLRRVLARLLDESEFLSPHGLRSLSRYHAEHPYTFTVDGTEHRVDYEPAESTTGMFGGNSNWRGPIWFPVNLLVVRSLLDYYAYYGDDFTVECPTGSGQQMTLFEVVQELSRRLVGIFTRDEDGRRPVFGGTERFQSDPHWRDHLLFYEYFHGDNGAGLGASHQTGWTGIVARLIQVGGYLQAHQVLEGTPVRAFYEPTTRAMTEERAERASSRKGARR
jgi:hypothetical protein